MFYALQHYCTMMHQCCNSLIFQILYALRYPYSPMDTLWLLVMKMCSLSHLIVTCVCPLSRKIMICIISYQYLQYHLRHIEFDATIQLIPGVHTITQFVVATLCFRSHYLIIVMSYPPQNSMRFHGVAIRVGPSPTSTIMLLFCLYPTEVLPPQIVLFVA